MRVIANRSSGKQGYAVAAEAAARGAIVTLVTTVDRPSCPRASPRWPSRRRRRWRRPWPPGPTRDVVVMAAAVADFRPVDPAAGKIKKDDGVPAIALEPTPDILAGLGRSKRPGQVLVGFAAETDDLLANAADKLSRKCLDLIVANDVSAPGDRLPARHERRDHHLGRRCRAAMSPCPTSGRWPARCSTPSSNARRDAHPTPHRTGATLTRRWTFTSESVTEGHPDKIADQVSDAVLDAILAEDPNGRVACETLLTTGLCVVAGEITTSAYVDIPQLARETIKGIGYDRESFGFDGNTCGVIVSIDEQSPNIGQGVDSSRGAPHRQVGRGPLQRPGRRRPGHDVRLRLRRDRRR